MKVIIQDLVSRQYLSSDNAWTSEAASARDFHFDAIARMALHFGKAGRLQIVHYFEEVNYCIAVRKATCRP